MIGPHKQQRAFPTPPCLCFVIDSYFFNYRISSVAISPLYRSTAQAGLELLSFLPSTSGMLGFQEIYNIPGLKVTSETCLYVHEFV